MLQNMYKLISMLTFSSIAIASLEEEAKKNPRIFLSEQKFSKEANLNRQALLERLRLRRIAARTGQDIALITQDDKKEKVTSSGKDKVEVPKGYQLLGVRRIYQKTD